LVCDHIVPHHGDPALFWDPGNVQTLCIPCHDGEKRRRERSGVVRGVADDGRPLDPSHPWNR
jgi:5-methylcytosine-specific restriction endonuclease McrA